MALQRDADGQMNQQMTDEPGAAAHARCRWPWQFLLPNQTVALLGVLLRLIATSLARRWVPERRVLAAGFAYSRGRYYAIALDAYCRLHDLQTPTLACCHCLGSPEHWHPYE